MNSSWQSSDFSDLNDANDAIFESLRNVITYIRAASLNKNIIKVVSFDANGSKWYIMVLWTVNNL